jgi:hypothetical protein
MPYFDPIHQSIHELISERDELACKVEDFRAEALAWRKRAEDANPAGGVRIVIETNDATVGEWMDNLVLERLKLRETCSRQAAEITQLRRMLNLREPQCNPCVSVED